MSDARSSRPSGRDDESLRGSPGEFHGSPREDPESLDDFAAVLYEELRTLAHRQLMGECADPALNTTSLVHDANSKLESHHARHARVVESRFFAGMTVPEVGDALDIPPATVKRDWAMARAWLNRQLAG